jgi:hypothetical protein
MASENFRRISAEISRRAGLPPSVPPTRDISPGPSGGPNGHHILDPSASPALDHKERAQQQERDAAARRKDVQKTRDNRGARP